MRTAKEIEEAAERLDRWAETIQASDLQDAGDLRAIARAAGAREAADAGLTKAVATARANGRSWGKIGLTLGISRQAARERFAQEVHTS